jgi:hypothetical protein
MCICLDTVTALDVCIVLIIFIVTETYSYRGVFPGDSPHTLAQHYLLYKITFQFCNTKSDTNPIQAIILAAESHYQYYYSLCKVTFQFCNTKSDTNPTQAMISAAESYALSINIQSPMDPQKLTKIMITLLLGIMYAMEPRTVNSKMS